MTYSEERAWDKVSDLEDKVKQLEAQIEKMKCCGNCAKQGSVCVAEEYKGILCGKQKDKWELKGAEIWS